MNHSYIDPEQCKGCGVCVKSCPNNCLSIQDQINKLGYEYAKFTNPDCTACGICYYVCPELGTITVFKQEKESKEVIK